MSTSLERADCDLGSDAEWTPQVGSESDVEESFQASEVSPDTNAWEQMTVYGQVKMSEHSPRTTGRPRSGRQQLDSSLVKKRMSSFLSPAVEELSSPDSVTQRRSSLRPDPVDDMVHSRSRSSSPPLRTKLEEFPEVGFYEIVEDDGHPDDEENGLDAFKSPIDRYPRTAKLSKARNPSEEIAFVRTLESLVPPNDASENVYHVAESRATDFSRGESQDCEERDATLNNGVIQVNGSKRPVVDANKSSSSTIPNEDLRDQKGTTSWIPSTRAPKSLFKDWHSDERFGKLPKQPPASAVSSEEDPEDRDDTSSVGNISLGNTSVGNSSIGAATHSTSGMGSAKNLFFEKDRRSFFEREKTESALSPRLPSSPRAEEEVDPGFQLARECSSSSSPACDAGKTALDSPRSGSVSMSSLPLSQSNRSLRNSWELKQCKSSRLSDHSMSPAVEQKTASTKRVSYQSLSPGAIRQDPQAIRVSDEVLSTHIDKSSEVVTECEAGWHSADVRDETAADNLRSLSRKKGLFFPRILARDKSRTSSTKADPFEDSTSSARLKARPKKQVKPRSDDPKIRKQTSEDSSDESSAVLNIDMDSEATRSRLSYASTDSLPSPLTKEYSFLECVILCLKGEHVCRRKHRIRSSDLFIYLSDDFEKLHWTSQTKEGFVHLKSVRQLMGKSTDVLIQWGEADYLELTFSSKEKADIWFSGLSCLVSPKAKVRARKEMDSIANYNLFLDSYGNKPLTSRARVDDFILLSNIGKGAFGTVKLAISRIDKKFYAVKILQKVALKKQQRTTAFNKSAGKIPGIGDNREIAIMKKLSHPNVVQIVRVYDDPENECIYIVLEYMPLGSVMDSSKLEGTTPIAELKARSMFLDVLVGLEYLHQNRIVHRDIKPENLLTKGDGTVKISDFGMAKMYDISVDDGIGGGAGVGTPAFTAPELCLCHKAPAGPVESYPADVWSLGATLYYMVYGRVPFVATSQYAMYDIICSRPLEFPEHPKISKNLHDLLRSILVKDPANRATIDDIWRSSWVKEVVDAKPVPDDPMALYIAKAGQASEIRKTFNLAKMSKNKLLITEADLREAVMTVTKTSHAQTSMSVDISEQETLVPGVDTSNLKDERYWS